MNKLSKINQVVKDIKSIKIQGARNIAKSALYAYSLLPTKETKEKLVNSRPTEPMLVNTLEKFDNLGFNKTLAHFQEAQDKINKYVFSVIKNNSIIFTHCHSTNVTHALIYAKKNGKKFEVYNTETRPLYQGRKTTNELIKAKIKVTTFVDSAARIALTENKISAVFIGADAIIKDAIINKVGSGMISEIAFDNKIPVYIIADSWKYSSKKVKIEERDFHEVWENAPNKIKIRNPAFERVPEKYLKAIISELGISKLKDFIKKQ